MADRNTDMATYTREGLVSAGGRLAAHVRHHPDSDHADQQRDLMEASLGYRMVEVRRRYPGVTLTDDQVDRLTEVLR